jgi:hypothetical protein
MCLSFALLFCSTRFGGKPVFCLIKTLPVQFYPTIFSKAADGLIGRDFDWIGFERKFLLFRFAKFSNFRPYLLRRIDKKAVQAFQLSRFPGDSCRLSAPVFAVV